jgi:hypothetical protein
VGSENVGTSPSDEPVEQENDDNNQPESFPVSSPLVGSENVGTSPSDEPVDNNNNNQPESCSPVNSGEESIMVSSRATVEGASKQGDPSFRVCIFQIQFCSIM